MNFTAIIQVPGKNGDIAIPGHDFALIIFHQIILGSIKGILIFFFCHALGHLWITGTDVDTS